MDTIKTALDTSSNEYQENYKASLERREELYQLRSEARQGGSEKARKLHKERGQMTVRERIHALIDPGSPFFEISELAGLHMYDGVPPGGSMVTGVGRVKGRNCMIIANDPTVKGGTLFGITCKKHVRAQTIARRYRLPCITMVQSGGAFLPDVANIFPDIGHGGTIMRNQVLMSAEGTAQIALVHGPSTAGGAYIPALCDEAVIIREQGAMFLGSPELVFAATGEVVGQEELGGAEMHCSVSGVTDHIAEDDAHALAITRNIVENLGSLPKMRWDVAQPAEPLYPMEEIYGIISHDPKLPTDNREILARLLDGSEFHEFKAMYGDTLICGFGRIKGFSIGILMNNGVLFSESASKAAHFIDLCCKRDIPILFSADINGFMVGREAEESGIAKHGAKMITAMASAKVPRISLITGGSYGAGYLAMCGRPFEPDFMFMWPNARAAIMGPDQAATTLSLVQEKIHQREGTTWPDDERETYKGQIRKIYEDFSNAYNFASHIWCDNVIDPLETRDVIAMSLDLAGRVPGESTTFGVFRQ